MAHCDSSRSQMDNFYFNLDWKLFRTGNTLKIKGMKIIPVHVDHSVPAAYGFILNTSAGIFVYSGDFRIHGPLSSMTFDFIKKVREVCLKKCKNQTNSIKSINRAKILMCEGTYVHKGAIESENLVKKHLDILFNDNPFDYILVKYDRTDWDRFRTFVDIAKKQNWKYVISEKEAYFYYLLNKRAKYRTMKNPNIKKDDHILILLDGNPRYSWQRKIRLFFKKYEKEWRFLKFEQLKNLKEKFFLFITTLHYKLMNNLPQNSNGLFISSCVDPYAEEFLDNTKTIAHKLLKLGIPSYRIHASGHAKTHDICRFVKEINPETLIPIHTEHPELFCKLFEKLDIKVIMPKYNESIVFNNK